VVFQRLHPDDLERVAASIRQSADSLAPWKCDYRVVLPQRGTRWLRGDARPERLTDGSIMWHGYISDSTEQHDALDALVRLQEAIESSLTGIAIASLDGALTYVNSAFLTIWGYEHPSQVIGRHASMFWQDPQEAMLVIGALQSTGHWSGELTAVCHDGRRAALQLNASRFTDAEGVAVGMLASFADVTETKRLQSELLQAKKMESVGRLAGGIAHDFNNLLTVMQASLELAYTSIDPADPVRQDLSLIEQATNSAASLTRQLLAFSRRQIIAPVVLDVNTLVTRVSGMLQRLLGEQVTLRLITAETPMLVRFDPGQAEQILVNLALNARDAMPTGGTLTIETTALHLDAESTPGTRGASAGEYVLLAVSDTGGGMTTETLEHAFEPFFTTKSAGQGTGLGLAMIHGAVSQNGGRVQAYSEVGHGTSFKIYLPRQQSPSDVLPAPPTASMPRGTESIVLVEDDATVRALMVRLLERQGYQVVDFSRGALMLEWLRATSAPIHLLLTDVIMPGMNGKELAEQANVLRPGLRVLYASGYTANVIVHHGVLKPDIEFLAKPFTAVQLADKVRAALDVPL
jgi:two-component system, cell cycle sensor histidine kinase and response regulator CckA